VDSTSQLVPNTTRAPKPEYEKWYNRAHWRRLRTLVLARDPICAICNRNASTIADHIKPHKGIWELFSDLLNLQGLCKQCHDRKTAAEDGGLGNAPRGPSIQSDTHEAAITGGSGKQFQSSTIDSKKIDKALEMDEDFLKGIPE
jgi:5-methylcytosine-specific restriction enzyme A